MNGDVDSNRSHIIPSALPHRARNLDLETENIPCRLARRAEFSD